MRRSLHCPCRCDPEVPKIKFNSMKNRIAAAAIVAVYCSLSAYDMKVHHVAIGTMSAPETSEVKLTLAARFQQYNPDVNNPKDVFDSSVNSPKSAVILEEKRKFYINNLESHSTSVYNLDRLVLIKVIRHDFSEENSFLFKDATLFDYRFTTRKSHCNVFSGKPVEGCFSHGKRYLWVTYYRRSFDPNASDPSAVAIIDTDKDEIVRVMPTGPLPKMIACSPDNRYVAVTHWGDNTIGIIDISGEDVSGFKYSRLFEVEKRMVLDFDSATKINRDRNCGYCLRGTVFSPDSKYLLVGRMGGGGIAVFDMANMSYVRSVYGMETNVRHLAVSGDQLYISTNMSGYVQKTSIYGLIDSAVHASSDSTKWDGTYVGAGVRTIAVSSGGRFVFAALNNESRVSVIRAGDMKVIASIAADSYPVGMALTGDDATLIVTAQGKSPNGGGQSVMVYKVDILK
jgi:hypothetical protein